MKKQIIFSLFFLITTYFFAQNTYLHCGKLIDTKSGKTLKEMTIIVSESKIVDVIKGYVDSDNNDDKIAAYDTYGTTLIHFRFLYC